MIAHHRPLMPVAHESFVARHQIRGGSGKRELADGSGPAPSAKPSALPLPPGDMEFSTATGMGRSECDRRSSCDSRENKLPRVGLPTLCLCLCLSSFCRAADVPAGDSAGAQVTTPQPPAPNPAVLTRLVTRTREQADTTQPDSQQGGGLASQLWSSRIASPAPNEDVETKLALRQLIEQVRSVKFDHGKSGPPVAPPAEPQRVLAATETAPAVKHPAPPEPPAVVPAIAGNGASFSPKAKRTLESLLQDPRQVHDPLEMAELLFLSGRPADAAAFYDKALERTSAGDVAAAQDRAWILFQLANCLRETDQNKAQRTYTQLITEYPDSPWTELAKAQGQLVGWYQKDQPHQLIASRQP